ncbi:MAG TPA: dienelactone hydrolase family protein [Thermoanaerobaculia bacterium]
MRRSKEMHEMGERVEFPSNNHTTQGYMAGRGPAIVVIQEWWGLVPQIERFVDRLAKEGFLAIAPDLFHGKTTESPDEAQRLKMELDAERAEREIAGAGEFLLKRKECTSKKYGVIGFCMGGGLAQFTGAREANVAATISFYGGFKKAPIDWAHLSGPILLIYGENDKGVPPEQGREIEQKLKQLGKQVELKVYPGADHAFLNDTGKNYKKDAAEDAWQKSVELFRRNVR